MLWKKNGNGTKGRNKQKQPFAGCFFVPWEVIEHGE